MNVIKLFRIKDWLITKLFFNFSFVLSVLYFTKPAIGYILETIFLTLIYILSIGAFGYFTNDWFDSETDRLSGKSNEVSKLSLLVKLIISISLVSLSFFPFLFVLHEVSIYLYLLIIQLALLLLYSVPPVKLKYSVIGIFADSLFSFVLPALICLFIANPNYNLTALVINIIIALIVWLFLIGLRSILIHQHSDFDNDTLSKTPTFTTRLGKIKTLFLIKLVLSFELICFLVLVFIVPARFGIVFIISFAIFLVFKFFNNGKKYWRINGFFDFASKLNVFYNYYLFLGIALFISIQISYLYLFFVLFFVFIKRRDIHLYYKITGAIIKLRNLMSAKK